MPVLLLEPRQVAPLGERRPARAHRAETHGFVLVEEVALELLTRQRVAARQRVRGVDGRRDARGERIWNHRKFFSMDVIVRFELQTRLDGAREWTRRLAWRAHHMRHVHREHGAAKQRVALRRARRALQRRSLLARLRRLAELADDVALAPRRCGPADAGLQARPRDCRRPRAGAGVARDGAEQRVRRVRAPLGLEVPHGVRAERLAHACQSRAQVIPRRRHRRRVGAARALLRELSAGGALSEGVRFSRASLFVAAETFPILLARGRRFAATETRARTP